MKRYCLLFLCGFIQAATAQVHYELAVEPAKKNIHVDLQVSGLKKDSLLLKMPTWTPGYYQFMNYAEKVSGFEVEGGGGWRHAQKNTWVVDCKGKSTVHISYDVKADRNFVAGNYVDSAHAFISPAGVCMYTEGKVTVHVKPFPGWNKIASGMDTLADGSFQAADFDQLYDSPILAGKLETLPSFSVRGVPHYFTGYNLDEFDKVKFTGDMKRIVESAVNIIGDIPYKHYTFLSIGPGMGGIEHLNSTAVSFSGEALEDPTGRLQMYSFLAHEYFHHYNVKRIRPVELGPFDYENGSRTEMLWMSEGFTVYYEYLIVRRAGLSTSEECLQQLKHNIVAHERRPGKAYQSLVQSSWNTWSDGPFGGGAKSISYYEKGPIIALLMDLQIRHNTNNKKSLDDVMQLLYKRYYQQAGRGFTGSEFRAVCEEVAGGSLEEIFSYVSTVKPIDYNKYLAYAGLVADKGFEIKRVSKPGKLETAICESIF
ncbi:M61 family metallopeptidase [Chitinophaga tropicalis]|uniref:M61 family peptidase n=1 Tax=Chitinophaga tropicalis TaxID=2683588 RepID=A0A7K1U4N4_9BACT|nr:M61 family peptidase [Chitinophaga tropicalis]MVT08955.1 M61 family peptidase [Chitinophaga tropicalis]